MRPIPIAFLLLLAAVAEAAFWGGRIASGLPPFYSSSIAAYGGQAYVFYTALGSNGTAIAGIALLGPSYGQILGPLQSPSSSPYLFATRGALAMLWTYSPSPGAALLYMSTLGPAGWGRPTALTKSGVVLSYASDGELIYAVWEPYYDPTYSTARLLVIAPNGTLLRSAALPGLVALNGAWRGEAVGVFSNGTYAVLAANGTVERLEASYAGASDVGLYVFSNGVLRYGGRSLPAPWASAAAPASGCGGAAALAWSSSGRLAVYLIRGEAVQLRNLEVPGLVVARGVCAGDYLYVEAESVEDHAKSIWAFVVPISPVKPAVGVKALDGTVSVSWDVPYPQEYNVTAVYLAVYLDGKPLEVMEVAPSGALNYTLRGPGNYTFAVTAAGPLGNATATAYLLYNATAAPTATGAPTTTSTPMRAATSATPAPTFTTTARSVSAGTGHGLLYVTVAIAAASAAVAFAVARRGRRRSGRGLR
ncbi:MAG: hypothetical protein ACP5KY_09695 [Thermoproteus sp.]